MNKMERLLSKIDAKTLQTSGAIIMALFTVYVLFKILTNDLTHIHNAIQAQTEVQKDTNAVLLKNAEALIGNTEILRIIERRLK